MNVDHVRRMSPPLAALAYPGLIWCGIAVSPIALVVALAGPIVGLLVAQSIDYREYPRARWVALFTVGTPALYSLLGGWLDFQRVLPVHGLHVWFAIWLACLLVVAFERRSPAPPHAVHAITPLRLRFAHGVSAAAITCFAAAHLVNHLGGLWGAEQHAAIMRTLRPVYRNAVVEPLLLACIAFQVISGMRLLVRTVRTAAGWISSVQVASAMYLLLFLLSHVSAVMRARYLRQVDTNWAWATDGLLTDPWTARLGPYYVLAVIALAAHGVVGLRAVMLHHRPAQHAKFR